MATDTENEVETTEEASKSAGLTERELAHYHAIQEREKYVRDLHYKYDIAKADAKAAKDSYDLAAEGLLDLIRRGPDAQMELPLGDPNQPWRDVPVEELELTAGTLKALTEAGITTLGKIADHTNSYELTDIKGIGPVAAEKLRERLDAWWAEHPDMQRDEPAKEAEQPEESN